MATFDVLLEDSVTGEKKWASSCFRKRFNAFWWADGNGSCDCNRELVFGHDTPGNTCHTGRYYVVETRGDLEGYVLDDFNVGYPSRGE